MALTYQIYSNGGTGGPVDYSTPIATTTDLSFVAGPLAAPSDNTFAVRCLDPSTNLEEANTDARVRIVIDADGLDVTGRPNPPDTLVVRPTASGGCRINWAYSPAGQGAPPSGFYVYLSPGGVPGYSSPAATVPYIPGRAGYSCDLSGLADGAAYAVAVRSYNAIAAETNTTVVATVVGDATPPDAVDQLSITVI
jgi:hypothetical protein